MNLHRAIESLTDEISVIKDNKIIGTAKPYVQRGDEFVSVIFEDENLLSLLAPMQDTVAKLGYKHFSIRFSPLDGTYISLGHLADNFDDPNYNAVDKALEEIRIVNANRLRFGIVPDTFKNVDGYRAIEKEVSTSSEQNDCPGCGNDCVVCGAPQVPVKNNKGEINFSVFSLAPAISVVTDGNKSLLFGAGFTYLGHYDNDGTVFYSTPNFDKVYDFDIIAKYIFKSKIEQGIDVRKESGATAFIGD